MTVIQNARLVAAGQVRPCDVAVEGGVIREIAHAGTLRGSRTVDAGGLYLSHGFVDTHVHGGGCDFMDGTEEAWHTAARLHLTHGTTCMVPTTLASTKEELLRAFAIYQRCKNAPGLRGALPPRFNEAFEALAPRLKMQEGSGTSVEVQQGGRGLSVRRTPEGVQLRWEKPVHFPRYS